MNWQTISNMSAIFTCIVFGFYLIGHGWTIHISKNKIFEQFKFESFDEIDTDECFNIAGEYGRVFSVSSPEGIRKLKIYDAQLHDGKPHLFTKGKLLKSFGNLKPNQKQYIRADFTDLGSNVYLEIERVDYIKTSFVVASSGKDGGFIQSQYESKMTLLAWLYYLCK